MNVQKTKSTATSGHSVSLHFAWHSFIFYEFYDCLLSCSDVAEKTMRVPWGRQDIAYSMGTKKISWLVAYR
jgi:hypothetical protein